MRTAAQLTAYLNGYDTEPHDDMWRHIASLPEFNQRETLRLDPLESLFLFVTVDHMVVEWTGDKWAVTGHLDDYAGYIS